MAYDRSKYQQNRSAGSGGNQENRNDRSQDKIEFVTLQVFTPIPKGEKNRVFFELSKAINHTRGEEYTFLKLVDQYKGKDGNWKYSGKNPTFKPDQLDGLRDAVEEVLDFFHDTNGQGKQQQSGSTEQQQHNRIDDLKNRLKGKSTAAPAADPYTEDGKDPFSGEGNDF